MKSTEKELKKAAVELNDLLESELNPKDLYNPKASTEEIVKWVKAAAKILEPDDELTAKTQAVIADVLGASKAEAPAKKSKKAPEPEDDEDDDEEEAEEEEEIPAPKKSKKAPVVVEEEDEDDEEEEETTPKKKAKKVVEEVPVKKSKKAPVVEDDDDDDDEDEDDNAPVAKKSKKEVPIKKEKKEKIEITPKWQILIKVVVENPKASLEQIEKILQKGGHSISKHSIAVYFKEVHFALSLM